MLPFTLGREHTSAGSTGGTRGDRVSENCYVLLPGPRKRERGEVSFIQKKQNVLQHEGNTKETRQLGAD